MKQTVLIFRELCNLFTRSMKYAKLSIICLLIVNLFACSNDEKKTKHQLLKQSINTLEQRFEDRKLNSIMEYVSKNYQDESGRKFKDIKRVVHLQLLRHKSLYIFSSINEVEWVEEGSIRVNVEIATAMAGKPIENVSLLRSLRADMIRFTVLFVLEDDVYKVESASWEWADPSDFI